MRETQVTRSSIVNNVATEGGGIWARLGLTIRESLVGRNSAVQGGGIFRSGPLEVIQSSVVANTAAQEGGGIYSDSATTLNLSNSTVAENRANVGAGLYLFSQAGTSFPPPKSQTQQLRETAPAIPVAESISKHLFSL